MTNDGGIQKFLDVEEAATNLSAALGVLNAEIGRYSTASESLEDVRAAIGPAADKYADLADQFDALAKALKEIGMPAVLDSQKALSETVAQSLAQVTTTLGQVNDGLEGARESTAEVANSLTQMHQAHKDGLSEVTKTLGQVNDGLKGARESTAEVANSLTQLHQAHKDGLSEILQGIEDNLALVADAMVEKHADLETRFDQAQQESIQAIGNTKIFVIRGIAFLAGLGLLSLVVSLSG